VSFDVQRVDVELRNVGKIWGARDARVLAACNLTSFRPQK
jgi:hypothetical protein